MNAGAIPLLTALVIGGPPAAAAPVSPAIQQTSGNTGIFPVPSMGAPGAVAGVGVLPIPPGPPRESVPPAAPLVAGKFLLPKGVRVTAFPGMRNSLVFEAPVVFGFRPGYVYRFELKGLPYNPGRALYPSIELRGVLVPRPGMKYMDYPIPIIFSVDDLDRALRGVMITKVIYLEDPEKAVPAFVSPNAPIEMPDGTETEAIRQATQNGRLMAIVRLGNRQPTFQEMYTTNVANTLLMPGQARLPAPALPPIYPYFGVRFYDPLLGAKTPTQECFPNGGDRTGSMGIGPDGLIGGLVPTDVAAEFTVDGKRQVAISNTARICAPRFAIRRTELAPSGFEVRENLAANVGLEATDWLKERRVPQMDIGREKANQYVGRLRPSVYVGKMGISLFIGTTRPVVFGQVQGVRVEAALVEPEQLTAYPMLGPLTVTKMIDPPGPKQSGDVVTITLRYAATGLRAISDIVVSDSLSGRLEYIPDSAKSDRAANFSAAENEVGSMIVRWEIAGDLLPGQAGTIKFKARVR